MDKGLKSISVDVLKDLFGTLIYSFVSAIAACIKNQQGRIWMQKTVFARMLINGILQTQQTCNVNYSADRDLEN